MNLTPKWSIISKFIFQIIIKCRKILPKKKSFAFGLHNTKEKPKIEHIYVINLNRHTDRLAKIKQELSSILDCSGIKLWNLTERFSAVDASHYFKDPQKDDDIDPIYTLSDQLFVEPQPLTLPRKMELDSPIKMSRPEVAIARSHIEVWRQMLVTNYEYALILEDDVWFPTGFAKKIDNAWSEIKNQFNRKYNFDILYLSYKEVKYGAPKSFISSNVFRPERGLWYLSGYVISRKGSEKLLKLLPCKGPVDLWINHKFKSLDVLAIKNPIIYQRRDIGSSNSYSILPSLTKIGAINSESASLFLNRPSEQPVFAFGTKNSGLSSLAMALSMLGYRCCSDLYTLPNNELEMLCDGCNDRIFDAYVNIGNLIDKVSTLRLQFPQAKFIYTKRESEVLDEKDLKLLDNITGSNMTVINLEDANKWKVLCEHVRCVPPDCSFPELDDLGQRAMIIKTNKAILTPKCEILKQDKSPWVIEPNKNWDGIYIIPQKTISKTKIHSVNFIDNFKFINTKHWFLRDDTFTDNLALFRPSNIDLLSEQGAVLTVMKETLGVRNYSAAALTSSNRYLYGKFEAVIKASKTPGVVTGIFLHRDSPRQEIDIEITGNKNDRLLLNVFYNPGIEGTKYDYGYRGASCSINLGFDASESYHRYTIEWESNEIRWLVDDLLVHRRNEWNPTPIPHLPMAFHVNLWPTRSKELAGRLRNDWLHTRTFLKSIMINANQTINNL